MCWRSEKQLRCPRKNFSVVMPFGTKRVLSVGRSFGFGSARALPTSGVGQAARGLSRIISSF